MMVTTGRRGIPHTWPERFRSVPAVSSAAGTCTTNGGTSVGDIDTSAGTSAPPSGSTPSGTPPPSTPPPSGTPPAGHAHPDPVPGPRGTRPVGWGLALITAGVLWSLSLAGVAIAWDLVLPAALVGVGMLTLLRPRAGPDGLVGVGIALLVLTLVHGAGPLPGAPSAGERNHVVDTVADLEERYDLGAGSLVLDLRELDLAHEGAEVSASVGLGDLTVRVPEGVVLQGRARTLLGEVTVLGESADGVGPQLDLDDLAPQASASATTAPLILDLQVGLGEIEVRR